MRAAIFNFLRSTMIDGFFPVSRDLKISCIKMILINPKLSIAFVFTIARASIFVFGAVKMKPFFLLLYCIFDQQVSSTNKNTVFRGCDKRTNYYTDLP